MIEITPALRIPENEVQLEFIRASGPGGQNVNKVSSAVQLRFDVGASSLPLQVKQRLLRLGGRRITRTGVLVIEARSHRTQEQNRADALARLAALVRKAAAKPRPRKRTRPSAASREKRLESKKRRGEIKRIRRDKPDEA